MITERMQQLAGVRVDEAKPKNLSAHSGSSWDIHMNIVYDGEVVAVIKQDSVSRSARKYKYRVEFDKDFAKKAGVYGGVYSSDDKALKETFKQIRDSERFGKLSKVDEGRLSTRKGRAKPKPLKWKKGEKHTQRSETGREYNTYSWEAKSEKHEWAIEPTGEHPIYGFSGVGSTKHSVYWNLIRDGEPVGRPQKTIKDAKERAEEWVARYEESE